MEGDQLCSGVADTFRIYVKENTNYFLTVRGPNVVLEPSNKADIKQYWVKFDKEDMQDGSPTFVLVNRFTGQALKQPSQPDQRMQLDIYEDDANDDQLRWTERMLEDNYNNIVSVDNENLVLDASDETRGNGPIASGNPIMLGQYNNNDDNRNQLWKFEKKDITYGGVFKGQKF